MERIAETATEDPRRGPAQGILAALRGHAPSSFFAPRLYMSFYDRYHFLSRSAARGMLHRNPLESRHQ